MRTKSITTATLIAASALFTATTYGQGVQVEAGNTEVQAGGGQGVQVQREGGQRARQGGGNMQNAQSRRPMGPAVIAQWALVDQQNMIELAQFGLQRTKNEAVRQLAEQVLQGHQDLASRLEPFVQNGGGQQGRAAGGGAGVGTDAAPAEARSEARQGDRNARQDRREASRDARELANENDPDLGGIAGGVERLGDRLEDGAERLAEGTGDAAAATREGIDVAVDGADNQAGGNNPLLEVHREIANTAAKQARTQLEKYQGVEFDEAFVGLLGSAHLAEQATLTVLKGRARGELATVLSDGLQRVQQHLAEAQRTMEQVEQQAGR